MDEPLNGGFICEKHKIGYRGVCPSCASENNKQPYSKKNVKKLKRLLKK